MHDKLKLATQIYIDEPDAAHGLCVEILNDEPNNVFALFLIGSIYSSAERYGLAHAMFSRVCEIEPKRFEAWSNLGMVLSGMGKNVESRAAFNRALTLKKTAGVYGNLALSFSEEGERHRAIEYANKGLALEPNHVGCKSTLAFANLGLGNWAEGWSDYRFTLGGKFRKVVSYGDEPLWNGDKGKKVIFYGEQGLGDEIMYASCIPDAINDCKQVVIDCDSRLEGLFSRSFPQAEVHGTRREDELEWDATADASCPIGQLPYWYRKQPADCPAVPYLVADPERVLQWKSLFKSYGKPVIGICWSGGSKHNYPKRRHMGLEAFRPLIQAVDAVYVSLQYTDATDEIAEAGLPVKEFLRATRTPDYDDTAGLVAALDYVVGIHTTVHHLAGALGVPATIMVPAKSSWIYAQEKVHWYASKLHRQKSGEEWKSTVERWVNDNPDFCRLR